MAPKLSKEAEEQLYDLYYRQKFFWGRDKLWLLARSKNIKVTRRQVSDWLEEQEVHQLYKHTSITKDIKRTVLKKQGIQIGTDLADMQKREYKGYRYILTAIDLFSKKAFAVAIKDKEGKTVANAFEKLLKNEIKQVKSVRSDNGSEFISKEFKAMLKKHNIHQVFGLAAKPQSNSNVERFNGILKRLIGKTLTNTGSYDWPKVVKQLVANYNESVHDTTKQTPNELNKGETANIDKAYQKIKKAAENKREKQNQKFFLGNKVRLKLDDEDPVKYNSGQTFSKKIYTIGKVFLPKSIINVPAYQVKDGDKLLSKKYYNQDLQLIKEVNNVKDIPEKFEISHIVKPLWYHKEPCFLVRWKYYRAEDDTIETRSKLIVQTPKLVKMYEKNHHVEWNLKFRQVSYVP